MKYYDMVKYSSLYNFYQSNGIFNRHIDILFEDRYEYISIYLSSVFSNVIVPIDIEHTPDNIDSILRKFVLKCTFKIVIKCK